MEENIAALFLKVGFTRWPLLLCSVTGLAIILDRLVYCFRIRLDYERFTGHLFNLLKNHKIKEALIYCRKHPNPIVKVCFAYLKNLNSSMRHTILTREGSLGLEKVEARLRGLAALTHITPLLGLLGTVAGLVTAFQQIETLGGQVRPEHLAGGIWEALLSTVFGLTIAIPCMAAYHGFESYADRLARRIQTVVAELEEFFSHDTNRHTYRKSFEVDDDIIRGAG